MNKPKVKLAEVVEALDLPAETHAYLNKVTGEVSWFTDEMLSAAQDEDLVIEDYPEWERDPIREPDVGYYEGYFDQEERAR